jgi:hypothetical protein
MNMRTNTGAEPYRYAAAKPEAVGEGQAGLL